MRAILRFSGSRRLWRRKWVKLKNSNWGWKNTKNAIFSCIPIIFMSLLLSAINHPNYGQKYVKWPITGASTLRMGPSRRQWMRIDSSYNFYQYTNVIQSLSSELHWKNPKFPCSVWISRRKMAVTIFPHTKKNFDPFFRDQRPKIHRITCFSNIFFFWRKSAVFFDRATGLHYPFRGAD